MVVQLDIPWVMTRVPNTFADLWDIFDKMMILLDSSSLNSTCYNFMLFAVKNSFHKL